MDTDESRRIAEWKNLFVSEMEESEMDQEDKGNNVPECAISGDMCGRQLEAINDMLRELGETDWIPVTLFVEWASLSVVEQVRLVLNQLVELDKRCTQIKAERDLLLLGHRGERDA